MNVTKSKTSGEKFGFTVFRSRFSREILKVFSNNHKNKSKMKTNNKTLLALFLTTTIAIASFGQATVVERDTIYTNCLTRDSVIRIQPGAITFTNFSWTTTNPNSPVTCSNCDSIVIRPTTETTVYILDASGGSITARIFLHIFNVSAQIDGSRTVTDCSGQVQLTQTPTLSYTVWSGVSGYTVSGNSYLIAQEADSGYVYLGLDCGVKLDSVYFEKCAPISGIADVETGSISVYPNPFTDNFTISPQIPYQLFDLLGREVKLTADLPKGSYILKTKTFNKVVIKQ